MHKDIEKFVTYTSEKPALLSVSILTNGTIRLNGTIRRIAQNDKVYFQVSLDGIDSTHERFREKGSFRKSIDFVTSLTKEPCSLGFAVCINSINYTENNL